jgi:hypothetical protein
MKKNLIFLFFLLFSILAYSNEKSIGSMAIISEEISHVNGVFECKVKITPKEAFTFKGYPEFKLPHGWKAILAPNINLLHRHCGKGNYFTFTLTPIFPFFLKAFQYLFQRT